MVVEQLTQMPGIGMSQLILDDYTIPVLAVTSNEIGPKGTGLDFSADEL